MKKAFEYILSVLLLCVASVAQVAPSKPQAPTQPPPPAQAESAAQQSPEHKISPEEAEELFRSVDEILQFASRQTGLPIRSKVHRKLVGREEVVRYLEQRMKDDPESERFDRAEVTLKRLGLLPPNFDLRQYLLGLLKEQVAGFYDAKTKTVYLLDWVDPVAQKPVLAHELTHALQDQNFDLERWAEVSRKQLSDAEQIERDEWRTARQGVVEGQAMIVLLNYMLAPLGRDVLNSAEMVDMMRLQMVSSGSTPMFASAPLILREGLIFPYAYGMDLVRRVLEKGGREAAFAGVFQRPPVDTRQVMHPETYIARQAVTQLRPADVNGVLKNYERFDTGGFGELDVRVLAVQWSGEQEAQKLAPEWRGGYYMAFRKKGQTAPVSVAMVLRFASAEAAKQFESVYRAGLKGRYKQLGESGQGLETEKGLVQFQTSGAVFVASEGLEAAESARVRAALIKSASR